MSCKIKLEEMKSANLSRGYRHGKALINMNDKKLIEIMIINNSYQIEFSTVKQLTHKLSSETIKNQLRSNLEDVKKNKNDLYNTNNYLITLRQLLNMARSYVDEELDTRALDNSIYKKLDKNEININRTQVSSPTRNSNSRYKSNYNKNKTDYKKRSRSSDDNAHDDQEPST